MLSVDLMHSFQLIIYTVYKCTKHQFICLWPATRNDWHFKNSKNHKKNITLSNCQCDVE